MRWFREHGNAGRAILLMALMLALAGPWLYEVLVIDVPVGGPCPDRLTMIYNGRCGVLISGVKLVAFAIAGVFSIGWSVVSGSSMLGERLRELTLSLSLTLLLLPILSLVITLVFGRKPVFGKLRFVIWLLATVSALLIPLIETEVRTFQFWGLWLYVGLAVCVVFWHMIDLLRSPTPVSGS